MRLYGPPMNERNAMSDIDAIIVETSWLGKAFVKTAFFSFCPVYFAMSVVGDEKRLDNLLKGYVAIVAKIVRNRFTISTYRGEKVNLKEFREETQHE